MMETPLSTLNSIDRRSSSLVFPFLPSAHDQRSSPANDLRLQFHPQSPLESAPVYHAHAMRHEKSPFQNYHTRARHTLRAREINNTRTKRVEKGENVN
ncbi:hypothetical protein Mapa_009074 [Marchantia paleacea]|nr:hypothetical protein Mapa_009074 [Marchantia paleacea]